MTDPERYVSADDLRAELPFSAEDFPVQDSEQFDGALMRALDSASELVESWTETVYQPTDTEQDVYRPGHVADDELPLPKRPVQSVASVTIGDAELSADEYHVRETYLVLATDDRPRWPDDEPVAVEWTYGYEECPEPVREAIIRLARNALDQIETDGYESDDVNWRYRTPGAIKAECASMVAGHGAPSYFGGAQIV